jgi:hypothetical protein
VISCSEAVRRLWEYVEDTPSPRERALLDAHLALCRRCCGEAEFAGELRGFLARNRVGDLPEDTAARLGSLIHRLEDLT